MTYTVYPVFVGFLVVFFFFFLIEQLKLLGQFDPKNFIQVECSTQMLAAVSSCFARDQPSGWCLIGKNELEDTDAAYCTEFPEISDASSLDLDGLSTSK